MFKTVLFIVGCVVLSCSVKTKKQATVSTPEPIVTSTKCGKTVLIDEKKYEADISSKFELLEASVVGDCLAVKINYAGGCGDVRLDLIDANLIMESEPVQRKIKLLFSDKDDCEALVTKDFIFDISSLKLNPKDKIILHLNDWEEPLLY